MSLALLLNVEKLVDKNSTEALSADKLYCSEVITSLLKISFAVISIFILSSAGAGSCEIANKFNLEIGAANNGIMIVSITVLEYFISIESTYKN